MYGREEKMRVGLELLLLLPSAGRASGLASGLLSCSKCHGRFLLRIGHRLLGDEHIRGGNSFGEQSKHAVARDAPDVDADAADGRPRERQYPFDVVWDPAGGQPEHGRLGEPHLEEEAGALRAEPSEG